MEKLNKGNFNTLLRVILGLLILALAISLFSEKYYRKAESKIKSQDGAVNVLILGKGGLGHAGADLTDTIILASVSLTQKSVSLISIPRDIWIPEIRAKINSAYYWGKQKPEFEGGLPFAKKNVQNIIGIPIDYALVLDFSSFREIVDAIGGIKIEVTNSFTDSLYPIEGREEDTCGGDKLFKCRYETIHFEKGINYMDGITALKFVRSRNGDNQENTDLAREARQQKVITAIKDKVMAKETLLNPLKLYKVWKVVRSHIETDIDLSSMLVLGRITINIDGKIQSYTIPEGLLINPPESKKYDYQYVFIPKGGNWNELQDWIKSLIK